MSSFRHAVQNLAFFPLAGVLHLQLEHEPVHLGFRQRIGPLLFNGILGGEHQERFFQGEGCISDGDLFLLHRFQEGALHLGWRAVDFIGQDDVGKNRSLLRRKTTVLLIEDHGADQETYP